jgi:hypothetical protein
MVPIQTPRPRLRTPLRLPPLHRLIP